MINIKKYKEEEATLVGDLIKSEGYRPDPYKDTAGKLTGGIGHLMTDKDFKLFDPNWDEDKKADYWAERLREDLDKTIGTTDKLIADKNISVHEDGYEALVEMVFNLGPNKIRQFTGMLKALGEGDFDAAADEMIDSKWHKDFVKWNGGKDTSNIRSRKLEAKMRNYK